MNPTVAFIGLGVIGFPIAAHLAQHGHHLRVYNRSPAKSYAWQQSYPGQAVTDIATAVSGVDFVISCVGNDADLRQIGLGPHGIFAHIKPNAIWIDHTTASADIAQEFAHTAQQHQAHFLDAPVSGGQSGAQQGILTIMVGGDAAIFARAEAILRHYAKAVTHIGASGSGQLAKMVNQIAIAGLLQSLSEAIHFGQHAGLDMSLVLGVLRHGAAQSWQMEQRGNTMIAGEFDFGFAVDWMRKDLGLCLAEARRNGASLPVAALVDQFYAEVQQLGGHRWDTSSLIARLSTPRSRA
ncbi:NAD(P)-dependent oxidoreductase [Thioflexithrix psekupsensis]|uniref:Oxidoreductase n=1 Tax=Thioflexithrix psekupsensis TaxID=1570016 RepID=A0A251X9V8_9GAMM|nr:NAD(P)-dependent oxidoreductase [Thioflexithrix psekupsensis]OUD15221.1 oxidoreductase [Thioflexithrix psekupsensis]